MLIAANQAKEDNAETISHKLTSSIGNVISEIFGVREALANPAIVATSSLAQEIVKWCGAALISLLYKACENDTITNLEEDIESDIFDKRKHEESKLLQKSKFKDSVISGMPEPESDDELERQDRFDPSEEGSHDKIARDTKLIQLFIH